MTATSLISAFIADSEGFKYFSDYLDAKRVDDVMADAAREIFGRMG